MSYLGQVELKSSEIRRIDVTGSTSATHTLTWTPASEQSLIITINGVKQQNNYSFSGTTLTLDDALLSADKMEVIGILDIGEAVVPPDDSISTAKIQDDAVTADKLANSINTEIAANTAKVTNATHTGDVTGATALTIANDAVDIAMLSATGTADATTFLRGDNSWATVSPNTPYFFASMSADQTGIAHSTWTKITFDNEEFDTAGAYDPTTNYRFTPLTAGKYYISCFGSLTNTVDGQIYTTAIYKNGSIYANSEFSVLPGMSARRCSMLAQSIIDFNGSSDYVEGYFHTSNSGSTATLSQYSGFYGWRIS